MLKQELKFNKKYVTCSCLLSEQARQIDISALYRETLERDGRNALNDEDKTKEVQEEEMQQALEEANKVSEKKGRGNSQTKEQLY